MTLRQPAAEGGVRRRRVPSGAETALWQAALRDVRPLAGRPPPAPSPVPPPAEAVAPAAIAPPAPRPGSAVLAPPLAAGRAPGLDKASAERLKRGRYPLDARLDLHGLTQDKAHRALAGFIATAAARGARCVLVITGKGLSGSPGAAEASEAPGVLRRAVPRWLGEPALRPAILAYAAAQPRDGGAGALYVLLRRRR